MICMGASMLDGLVLGTCMSALAGRPENVFSQTFTKFRIMIAIQPMVQFSSSCLSCKQAAYW